MDDNLITLLQELSVRATDPENYTPGILHEPKSSVSSGYTSSCDESSPNQNLDPSPAEEDEELRQNLETLFAELSTPCRNWNAITPTAHVGYDRTKLLVALLSNNDLMKYAIKRTLRMIKVGKKLEAMYRAYVIEGKLFNFRDCRNLLDEFEDYYREQFIQKINVARLYHAYYMKMIPIYNNELHNMRVREFERNIDMGYSDCFPKK